MGMPRTGEGVAVRCLVLPCGRKCDVTCRCQNKGCARDRTLSRGSIRIGGIVHRDLMIVEQELYWRGAIYVCRKHDECRIGIPLRVPCREGRHHATVQGPSA
eukprot:22251-Rhodomonas_salina.1